MGKLDEQVDRWMDSWMHGSTDKQVSGWIDVKMVRWIGRWNMLLPRAGGRVVSDVTAVAVAPHSLV